MTDGYFFYERFISVLQDKIPNKATLVNTITGMLAIDKDAVYRRLRCEVNFSFTEMAIIARKLGISLDDIVGIYSKLNKPAQVVINRYVNPAEIDYVMFNDYVTLLKSIRDDPNSKLTESANILPYFLCYDYEYITRYALFRWNLSFNDKNYLPFHEITIPEEMRILQKACCEYARDFKSTVYLFDYLIFQHLVANIDYFAKIRLINREDIALIKNDIIEFLNNLEKMAVTGKHEETGNNISLYVSDINFDTNYTLIESKNMHISLFRTYLIGAISTLDIEVFNVTNAWLRSMQKMSTLISVSGEKIRASFFDTQRKIIDTL